MAGLSLLEHVLHVADGAGAKRHYVVLGHGREEVLAQLNISGFAFEEVWQKEQKGTGHAVQTALPHLTEETIVILNGDGPLLRAETISFMLQEHAKKKADLTLGVMELENPFGYGRVITAAGGKIKKIVEEKEATDKEKKIRLVNGGLYIVSLKYLKEFLPKLKPSAKTGELYLTDILALGAAKKKKLFVCPVASEELMGVNDLVQLSETESIYRARKIREWQLNGVRVEDPATLFIDAKVVCEPGAELGSNISLRGKTVIGAGAAIESGCVIKDSVIESGVEIKAYSYLEESIVKKDAVVGPFARLRPGTQIGEDCKIGNFVEIKKSTFGKGAKASHLSYIGDATIGSEANLGCGFITCNYDGVNKHNTIVGDRAFVGSDVQAVAPIEIGKDTMVASGTTLTKNVPDGALAIARQKQENKEGYAERIRARNLAHKNNKGGK